MKCKEVEEANPGIWDYPTNGEMSGEYNRLEILSYIWFLLMESLTINLLSWFAIIPIVNPSC